MLILEFSAIVIAIISLSFMPILIILGLISGVARKIQINQTVRVILALLEKKRPEIFRQIDPTYCYVAATLENSCS